MNKFDLIGIGIKNLWRRKLRTSLTILGVVIGASAIIIMMSLGLGLEKTFTEQLMGMEDLTSVQVRAPFNHSDSGNVSRSKAIVLDDKSIKEIKKIQHVAAVLPFSTDYGIIATTGKKVNSTQVVGVDPEAFKAFDYKLESGRLLNENDRDSVVLGYYAARNFMNSGNRGDVWVDPSQAKPVDMNGDFIFTYDWSYGSSHGNVFESNSIGPKYQNHKVKVVGILANSSDWEVQYATIMSLKTLENFQKERAKVEKSSDGGGFQGNQKAKGTYETVKVKIDDMKYVEETIEKIKEMGFQVDSSIGWLNEMKKTTGVIQLVLGGIGAVSLLIAAIGITNTMIMSIYERTKEIGVMKVIGASIRDIQNLFLFEASMIGFIGGAIGVIFSSLVSFILNHFANSSGLATSILYLEPGTTANISYIPIWLIALAVIVSAGIGILAGYFPARRAMKLSALEAIRSE
ncbi:MAG: ABC transporter permease [Tissierellia bacterium]|nr:ABC transporter permease [Tissierellia bacterium]